MVGASGRAEAREIGSDIGNSGINMHGYFVSVLDFGAAADDLTDDSAVIQAAIASVPAEGGTVFFPAGMYLIGSPIVVGRSHVTLLGEGPQSILRLMNDVTRDVIVMPSVQGEPLRGPDEKPAITDVTITRLTLDGNRNFCRRPDECNFFGISIRQAQRVLISEVFLKDFYYDAIEVGASTDHPVALPNDITIRNNHILSVGGRGRNGIGITSGANVRVSQNWIEDTPSQQWQALYPEGGGAAGNGIDVEVEGVEVYVDDFVIEDNIIERMNTMTAGDAIALQPAYGPIRNGIIRNNVLRNHHIGVGASDVTNLTIQNNWFLSDSNFTYGRVVVLLRTVGASVAGNVMNDRHGLVYESVVYIDSARNTSVAGNKLWGANERFDQRVVRIFNQSDTIRVQNNRYLPNVECPPSTDCFLELDPQATNVTIQNNMQVSSPAQIEMPPTVTIQVPNGAVFTKPGQIEVTTTDTGEGVARVYFYVDGIPQDFKNTSPYRFAFDPRGYTVGGHTLAARAVDKDANVSQHVRVNIVVSQ